jgi:RNA polymerase sigma factor (sigma-70 family)
MTIEQLVSQPRQSPKSARYASPAEQSDTVLLQRFAENRDESAFSTLVHRHGPLVMGVCRRVLDNPADVDDAFQGTFMVLVRKAGSLRKPELLGNWLYGVAYRVARKVRTVAAVRRQIEMRGAAMRPTISDSPPESTADDLRPVIDEELQHLPEKYRLAVVLCYLEGKTNEEAAATLKWPTGTVKGRLSRARELLRGRLLRRGLFFTLGGLTIALSHSTAHAGEVPAALSESTVRAGLSFAANEATTSTAATVARLVLRSMRRRAIALLTLPVLFVSFAMGGGALAYQSVSSDGDGFWSNSGEPAPACHHVQQMSTDLQPLPAPPETP